MISWLENDPNYPPLPWRLCHNEGNGMFVILNPSPCVTLSEAPVPVSFSRTRPGKGLAF